MPFYMSGVDMDELKNRYQVVISALDSRFFGEESCRRILMEHFKVGALVGLGLGGLCHRHHCRRRRDAVHL